MQAVITAEQARAITKNRKPLTIARYEDAVAALKECTTLDEMADFDNLADAAAAWAKIYHDDQVKRLAAALKLHAYASMGALAKKIADKRNKESPPRTHGTGRAPGAHKVLMEHGLPRGQASAAAILGRRPEVVKAALQSSKIPSPCVVTWRLSAGKWNLFTKAASWGLFHRATVEHTAGDAARAAVADSPKVQKVLEQAEAMQEWLSVFIKVLKAQGVRS